MTPQEQERMEILCSRIALEKDPADFLDLVQQLNDLLDRSQRQLDAARLHSVKPEN